MLSLTETRCNPEEPVVPIGALRAVWPLLQSAA
jgi:hypothetical protein